MQACLRDRFAVLGCCHNHQQQQQPPARLLPATRLPSRRVAGSLLHAVGLEELVCDGSAAYEQRVLGLARNPGHLAAVRRRLDRARTASSLFDGAAAARALEALYERMWARALAGLPPDHLPVQPA